MARDPRQRAGPRNAQSRPSTDKPKINAGGLWYKIVLAGEKITLTYIDTPAQPQLPDGALPDGKVATGKGEIARAWLAEPTTRYDHGILGDKIEAGALVIETRDGKRQTVRLKDDAVFEDLSRGSPISTATAMTRSSW